MLTRNKTVPGAEIVVNAQINSGLPKFDSNEQTVIPEVLPFVSIRENFELFGKLYAGRPGMVLTVLEGPRDVDGFEAARVRIKDTEKEGEVYWEELEASCDYVS